MRERIAAFRAHASPRERVLVMLGVLITLAAVAYGVIAQPLSSDLARLGDDLAQTRARTERARAAAAEIAGLKREAQPPRTSDARAAAERVVNAAGLRPQLTALDVQDGRVRLTFSSVDFTALAALLDRLGREEQLFPVEALLATRVEAGTVRAEIALARAR